jgi:hypothetical protein
MASKDTTGKKSKVKPAATKKATTKAASAKKAGGKFRIVVGRDWELEVAEIEGDGGQPEKVLQELQNYERLKDERREGAGRLALSTAIVAATLVALVAAAAWGWMHADFSGVSSVWAVASVPLGWVAGYLFKNNGRTITHSQRKAAYSN